MDGWTERQTDRLTDRQTRRPREQNAILRFSFGLAWLGIVLDRIGAADAAAAAAAVATSATTAPHIDTHAHTLTQTHTHTHSLTYTTHGHPQPQHPVANECCCILRMLFGAAVGALIFKLLKTKRKKYNNKK